MIASNRLAWILLLTVTLAAAAVIRLLTGSTAWGWPDMAVAVLRADRMVLAGVVGAALAISGVALQSLLRNPLAEPFILGLSTGAATGMVGQWWIAAALGIGLSAGYVGALVGSGVIMALVYVASRRHGVIDPLGMLLTGVVLSTINGALILLAVHLNPGVLRVALSQWMMGFLDEGAGAAISWSLGRAAAPLTLAMVAATTAIGWVLLLRSAWAMDVASLSAEEAEAAGVDLGRLRLLLFVTSGTLAAGGVVLAGPIAFVGLICPHIARRVVGPSHGRLISTSAILGAALLMLADAAGAGIAWLTGSGVVPLGVFTAVLGGVAFLWMLRPSLGRSLD